jgi:NOL1/NOP2/fmu family ribosome biogenesis protein
MPPPGDQLRLWRIFAEASLTVPLPEERLHAHNDRLYLLPAAAMAAERLRIVRYGLLLGEMRPGRFQPAPDLALALRAADATAALDLPPDDAQLAAYMAGAELPQPGADGWVLVAVAGFGLGWAKRTAGRLKNHYPRLWRRG